MDQLLDSRLLAALLMAATIVTGYVSALVERSALKNKLQFTNQFMGKLVEYAKSGLYDEEAYEWMIRKSEKMQDDLGRIGVFASYKPAGANYVIYNVPVILNMLPQLHTYANDEWLRDRPVTEDVYNSVRDAVLRHIGTLENSIDQLNKSLLNPIKNFRRGVGTIVMIPLDLLEGLGIFSSATNQRAHQSIITRVVAGAVALVGFMSGVVTIFAGWQGFVDGVAKLWP